MKKKETIYFLEWIEKEFGVDIDIWLENCKDKNTGWKKDGIFERKTKHISTYSDCFIWIEAIDKSIEYNKLDREWRKLIKNGRYHIKFSRFPIQDFKVINPESDFHLNFD